jgi:hypothetical protein
MSDKPDDEKKIIVDEDWKDQVQAEKEAAKQKEEEGDQPSPGAQASEEAAGHDYPLPPASLETLVSMLATQAMVSLGALPNPIDGEAQVHLPQARHFVDLLTVLDEKTNGNRTAGESAMLDGLLHQLRMAVLEASKQTASQPPAAGDQPA